MKRVKKKGFFKILPLVIILVTAFFLVTGMFELTGGKAEILSPQQGSLDLYRWDSAQNGLINLSGEWEFYWQKLLSRDELYDSNTKPDLYVTVPSVWSSYELNGKKLSGFGYGTYVLKVKNYSLGTPMALHFANAGTAYRLYIGDKLIASNGAVGINEQSHEPGYELQNIQFQPPGKAFEIILQVSNYDYSKGGMWYPLYIGTTQAVQEFNETIIYKDVFLLGAFTILALYYLNIFLMRKKYIGGLFFVLLCLIAIIRTMITGEYIIYKLFPFVDFQTTVLLDFITLYWYPAVFTLLIQSLLYDKTSTKAIKLFIGFGCLMTVISLITPVSFFTGIAYLTEAVVFITNLYAMLCVAKAAGDKPVDAAVMFAGSFAMTFGGIHDILYNNNLIEGRLGEISAFCFLVFISLSAFLLARKFSKALKDSENLSEKLLKLDKLKDEFLANTSHELKTPLNAIINIADSITRGTEGAINEKQKTSLAMITSSGKRLANLINDILDYSKLKNFDLKMNFEAINLKRTVDSVMNVLGRLNQPDGVQMLIDIPGDIPDIYADENRLIQILYNLVGNARKFTESGYVKVSALITGNMVEICVEDTGIGIPEDKLDIIFDSFRQLEDSLTRKSGGAGLGLSITKYLVEAHGGKIRVETKIGEGSKFYFTIPVSIEAAKEQSWRFEPADAKTAAAGYSENYMDKFPYRYKGGSPHIMLADDNKANLMSLAGILRMENYSVTAVASSAEFFAEFKAAGDVSLVILDVMLPGLSGYEICREIRKSFTVSELPVLMLTARTTTQDIVMGMEAGANDYLAKPFDTDELLARVRTLIQLKQSVDKARASELAFLQAQIKPHFLFNALNTFVSISLYDVDRARNLITEFSNYLRKSFDFKDLSQLAPLKNELELVRAYLEIEKARFEERIEAVFDLPGDMEASVPILMLQPIVENAVIHGILPKDEGGRIEICIERDDEALHFKVKDNGVGIEPVKNENIFKHEFGSGVGLSNINSRLKKLYGKGLQISSVPGVGTEVKWRVPVNRREGEQN